MLGAIARVWFGLWLGCFTVAAAQLPPDVLVDKYLLQAKMLSEEKDHKGALEAMDRILALQKEHDLTLPEAFPFQYAQTALAAGSAQATIESANRYLTAAGREGKYYREALELLVKAERRLQELAEMTDSNTTDAGINPQWWDEFKAAAADRVGSTPVKPEIEPQPQAVLPASTQTQETSAAQPVVDCKKWNTKKFFRKATVEDVRACINAGVNLDARDGGFWSDCNKCTPLHRAAYHNENPAVIETLLKAGANLETRADEKVTPLNLAARYNENPAVIETLLKAGANLETRDSWENTPLHWAAYRNDNPEVVKALIDAGADLTAWNEKDNTPLQMARRRHRKVLRNAWARLPESQKAAARARRKSQSDGGGTLAALVAGVAGGAIASASGVDAATATEIGTTIGGSVLAGEAGGNTGGTFSSTPTIPDGSSSEFDTALRNLENSCGERFRSAFSEQNHGRYYCLDAFARHCALKKGHNQQQLDALRHDFEVLRSQGQESGCPYFGVFGVTYAPGFEREAIDRAEKETKKAQEERQRRLDEQARQDAQEGKRRVEENNARMLASDCDCISKDERDGKLTCLDGIVGLTESHCNVRFRRR